MHTISRTSGTGPATSRFGGRWQGNLKPINLASRVLERLIVWQERAEQRHALAMLDDRQLKDIGLSRADIVREISRPFWQG